MNEVQLFRGSVASLQKQRDEWVAKHKECTQLLGEAMQDRADMAVERDALKRHLSSLLARIHRDGGHYESAHGTDLAVEHADVKVAVTYSNVHELLVRIVALEKERDAYAAAADAMAAAHKVERDALRDAARFALDALEYHTAQTRPIERTQIAIEILKAVLLATTP